MTESAAPKQAGATEAGPAPAAADDATRLNLNGPTIARAASSAEKSHASTPTSVSAATSAEQQTIAAIRVHPLAGVEPQGEQAQVVSKGSGDATMDDIAGARRKSYSTEQSLAPDFPDQVATRKDDSLLEAQESLDDKIRAHLDGPRREKKDPLLGETLGGRFLVLKKIGGGGMGAVYRARQEGMDRDVAVKVLLGDLAQNDTVLRRFTLEALAVSRLRHPNTIQIFDYGQTPQGNPYIAMELLEGQTLHDLLRAERPLPIRRALRIMDQVAASLAEAHGKGIVHRDLKPENIFLVSVGDNPDFVKVLDFGVAKLRDNKDEKGTLTQAGSIFGTPRYMSPEQCSAQPVDGRSDLYALGVILYEMITGQAPFSSEQPLTLLLAHVNEPPPPPASVTDKQVIPAEVSDLVLKLLEKVPANRVQAATELSKACHELAVTLPAAFDQCVGSAQAENLGVRLASTTTDPVVTARTLRVGDPATQALGLQTPDLQLVAQPGRNRLMWLAGLLVLGLATGVALLLLRQPPPAQIVEKQVLVDRPVPSPTALAADSIEVVLVTVPDGARVNAGPELLGTSPLTVQRKKGAPPESWTLLRDGFESETIQVQFGQSTQIKLSLKAVAQEPRPGPGDDHTGTPKPRPKGDKVEKGPETPEKPQPKSELPKVETPTPEPKLQVVPKPEPPPKPKPKPEELDDLK